MLKYCHFINLILLSIPHDIFNQRDYDYSDYTYKHFPRHWIERTDRFKVRSFSGVSNRGVLKNIKNKSTERITNFGKCLTLCVLGWHKTCWKEISCIWKCLVPHKPLPGNRQKDDSDDSDIFLEPTHKTPKQNDSYIESRAKNKKESSWLTPGELIRVIKCDIKCLSRHLPHDVISLSKFLVCSLTRCLCA